MSLIRSEQWSGDDRVRMQEHPDPASVLNYLSFLNTFLQANNIRGDTLNNNRVDKGGERKAKMRRLGPKFAWQSAREHENNRKPPEDPAGLPPPASSEWELPKSAETSSVFKIQSGASGCYKDLADNFITVPQAVGPMLKLLCCQSKQWFACGTLNIHLKKLF